MYRNPSPRIRELEQRGVVWPGAMDVLPDDKIRAAMAHDAEPTIVTSPNAAIPYANTIYFNPQTVEAIFAPNNIVKIVGREVQKGDWTTTSVQFTQAESTGEVSSYTDWNNNGVADVNVTFPVRENYLFQTMMRYGEREVAMWGEARINLVNQKAKSVRTVMDKWETTSYAFGISNLKVYGLLNDPSLPAAITPLTESVSGTNQTTWANKTAAGIYADVQAMWKQAQTQLKGIVSRDARMVLAMAPDVESNLTKTNQYNVNVSDQIKKNFPNMRIETAVQYDTLSGQLVQLIVEEIDGVPTAECCYSMKLRAFRIVQDTSSAYQKFGGGTYGTVIYRPTGVIQMLGV